MANAAFAMRCPVLRYALLLPGDKAAFSSEHFWVELRVSSYAFPMRCPARVLKKSVEEEWEAVRARRDRVQVPTHLLCDVESYALALQCPKLAWHMMVSACVLDMRCPVLT
eukprot:1488778-Rhodomonas_salina.4